MAITWRVADRGGPYYRWNTDGLGNTQRPVLLGLPLGCLDNRPSAFSKVPPERPTARATRARVSPLTASGNFPEPLFLLPFPTAGPGAHCRAAARSRSGPRDRGMPGMIQVGAGRIPRAQHTSLPRF